jgi:L-threonylcarbamoyladenylate synthase
VTEVIKVSSESPDPAAIVRAADCLRCGGLVAFPTETVYGLGVNALDRTAVRRLYAAKQRPLTDPLIVHVGSFEMVSSVAARVPASAAVLSSRFWPGPLTLVVPRSPRVPDEVTAGLPSVAVRVPAHPVARAVIIAAGVPVAAPSANLFSRPSPTLAAHVAEDLDGRIDLILDGGATAIGVESTVLDLTSDVPVVLRPGAVTIESLREVLSEVRPLPITYEPAAGNREPGAHGPAMPSPGMLEKHYSPRAALTVYEGEASAVLPLLAAAATAAAAAGKSVAVIATEEDRHALASLAARPGVMIRTIGSAFAPDLVAARLYTTLRELDAAGVDAIFVRGFPDHGLFAAVQDRLRRAAGGRIVRR